METIGGIVVVLAIIGGATGAVTRPAAGGMLNATESSPGDTPCLPPNHVAHQRNSPAWDPRSSNAVCGRCSRLEDDGKFVALDVQTGDYEVDEDDYAAVSRLRARNPAAQVWLSRVGQPAAYRMRRDR